MELIIIFTLIIIAVLSVIGLVAACVAIKASNKL